MLGIALVAMAEDLGAQMTHRTMEHLLQYGGPSVRKAVPLALALMHVADPDINVMDVLSRLTHDADAEVAQAALISLGFLGAGTNNARLAGMLRNLSSYYYKDPTMLFLVRVAQGQSIIRRGAFNWVACLALVSCALCPPVFLLPGPASSSG